MCVCVGGRGRYISASLQVSGPPPPTTLAEVRHSETRAAAELLSWDGTAHCAWSACLSCAPHAPGLWRPAQRASVSQRFCPALRVLTGLSGSCSFARGGCLDTGMSLGPPGLSSHPPPLLFCR